MASMRTTRTNISTTTNTNYSKKSTPIKTPFCVFCFNLGKPSTVYTSHYIRETPAQDSRIVCPELKACKCMGCGKTGHTISKCKAAAPYKQRYNTEETPKADDIKPKNIYSLLVAEDENNGEPSDDDEETATVNTIISIASSTTTQNEVSMRSYAAAVMSIAQSTEQPKEEIPETTTTTYDFTIFKRTKHYTSWADADSDDDEE